ncbi:MAG: hypothetical protein QOH85_1782, partial [Acidobacteriaceae bacterium]|nr:hypothetical protein [Acidobacteriaceae bacterium]
MLRCPSSMAGLLHSLPRPRFVAQGLVVLAALFAVHWAHPQSAKRLPRSTVSGHVLCADANAPARLAKVTLNPLRNSTGPSSTATPGTTTGLDGGFELTDIPPGRYLVLVDLAGYISGISALDQDTRQHLNDVADTPPPGSTVIEVANGQPVSVELTIERGASVGGAIRYDDGSPAIGVTVGLEHKNNKGAWEAALQSTSQSFDNFAGGRSDGVSTDSAGRFHIDGVPAGEYLLHAHLVSQTVTLPVSGTGALGVYTQPGLEFNLYSGDAFWRKDAKPLKLGAGDEVDVDMVIPLAKLQTVSGSVVAATDGHGVSLGSVTLELRDDPSEVRTAVMGRDGQFRFLYVPEADYVLKTQDAADSVTAVTSNGAARPNQEDIPTHQYGSAQIALHVGDG